MDTSKILELLDKGTHIGLLVPEEANLDILSSAEAVAAALRQRKKNVGLLRENPQIISRPELFPTLAASSTLLHEFVISVDGTNAQIGQLRYEKDGDKINVIFSPKNSSIKEEHVSFREGKLLCDAAITFGITDIADVKSIAPEVLSDLPILNLDVSRENKNYGEINVVHHEKSSLSELTYEFLVGTFQEPVPQDAANLLLAGIVTNTKDFAAELTTADTMLTVSELIRLGADLASARTHLSQNTKQPGLIQLSGRASVRSRFDTERKLLWTFLTPEDFEKTGRGEKDVTSVLTNLRREFPPHRLTSLLWQPTRDSAVHVMCGGDRELLSSFAAKGVGAFQSPYLLLKTSFESFKEAEEIIASLIETAL